MVGRVMGGGSVREKGAFGKARSAVIDGGGDEPRAVID